MVELGYGCAWRVLDAQYFGVPQRRRRVFVVGCPGDWRRAAEILFEPASLRRDPPPSRKKGEKVANAITERPDRGGGNSEGQRLIPDQAGPIGAGPHGGGPQTQDLDTSGAYIPEIAGALSDGAHRGGGSNGQDVYAHRLIAQDVANPLTERMTKGINSNVCEGQTPIVVHGTQDPDVRDDQAHAIPAKNAGRANAVAYNITPSNSNKDFNARKSGRTQALTPDGNRVSARGGDVIVQNTAATLSAGTRQEEDENIIAFAQNQRDEVRTMDVSGAIASEPGMKQQTCLHANMRVRRLTPLECERLQGFPDGYTDIPGASDSARYRALGNTMAVPVMAWIGKRIERFAK